MKTLTKEQKLKILNFAWFGINYDGNKDLEKVYSNFIKSKVTPNNREFYPESIYHIFPELNKTDLEYFKLDECEHDFSVLKGSGNLRALAEKNIVAQMKIKEIRKLIEILKDEK